jgi:transposase
MKALRLRAHELSCARQSKPCGGGRRAEAQQVEYIALDAHKHYTLASVARPDGHLVREERVEHDRGALRHFLERCEPGSPVAVETIGNWYWIVDEIEAAGCRPNLVHARKAKLMMGMINKTDKLDARGLNQLQRNGTLPTVWIPPGELRDQRDLPRTRMVLVRQRTQLKNRIHAVLAKYALHDLNVSDLFGSRAAHSFGSGSTFCRLTRHTRPSNCSSKSRIWTVGCASSNNGCGPCSR